MQYLILACVGLAIAIAGGVYLCRLLYLKKYGVATKAEVIGVREAPPRKGKPSGAYIHTMRYSVSGKSYEEDDKAGYSRTDPHLCAKPVERIWQEISHRHEQHDVHVHLCDIFCIFNIHMRPCRTEAICENSLDKAQETEIDMHRVLQILEQCNMHLIIPRG